METSVFDDPEILGLAQRAYGKTPLPLREIATKLREDLNLLSDLEDVSGIDITGLLRETFAKHVEEAGETLTTVEGAPFTPEQGADLYDDRIDFVCCTLHGMLANLMKEGEPVTMQQVAHIVSIERGDIHDVLRLENSQAKWDVVCEIGGNLAVAVAERHIPEPKATFGTKADGERAQRLRNKALRLALEDLWQNDTKSMAPS